MSRAFVNARPKVSPIGTSRKVTSRTAAGASMSSATVVDERLPRDGIRSRRRERDREGDCGPGAPVELRSAAVMVVMSVAHWK
ncbi:hypothetical protein GCM10009817_20730 [Terrabacter lapilli]|uniref:Uncharacterized protein n=1 Tax=Terrabacter lapilli TaxID=436231 RepID=A0ABP5DGS4_9MICO